MHTPPGTPSQLSERVASEIRAEMARRGITQSTLADRLGENQAWVSRRIASGLGIKIPLDLNDVERIADVLNLPAGQLVERATTGAAVGS